MHDTRMHSLKKLCNVQKAMPKCRIILSDDFNLLEFSHK